jgi:hypothetical protein
MAGTIDVGVMSFLRTILDMCRGNSNSSSFFLGSFINLIVILKIRSPLLRKIFRNCLFNNQHPRPKVKKGEGGYSSERRFSMIDMADCANV